VLLAIGSFIKSKDVRAEDVAVVGRVVSDLFGGANPPAKQYALIKFLLRFIGVTVSKGGTGFSNQDDIVFIPIITAQKTIFGIDYVTSISLSAAERKYHDASRK